MSPSRPTRPLAAADQSQSSGTGSSTYRHTSRNALYRNEDAVAAEVATTSQDAAPAVGAQQAIHACPAPDCTARYSSLSKLTTHINSKHRDVDVRLMSRNGLAEYSRCAYCPKAFIVGSSMAIHLGRARSTCNAAHLAYLSLQDEHDPGTIGAMAGVPAPAMLVPIPATIPLRHASIPIPQSSSSSSSDPAAPTPAPGIPAHAQPTPPAPVDPSPLGGTRGATARARAAAVLLTDSLQAAASFITQLPPLDIEETPPIVPPSLLTPEGLHELVSLFRTSIDYPHHTWITPTTKLLISILQTWDAAARVRDGGLLEAQHAAAFLLIPGLMRAYKATHQRPIDLLHGANESSDPLIEKIDKLVDLSRLSAAMAIVEDMHHNGRNTTPPLPQAQQQTLLSALNPPANARDLLSAPSAESVEAATSKLIFEKESIAFYVRRMSSAATPGWSGWTIRFIQRLVLNSSTHAEVLQDRLARFFSRWSTGKLHPLAASMFATSRAVLIPKRGGGWRPLCIGDAWYRLISSGIGLLVIKETSKLLLPIQLGSGFSGGGEI
ncbi:hypothetical protein B484DRAFT_407222, partial [Ochromonadaceae sp. CCMP2298]